MNKDRLQIFTVENDISIELIHHNHCKQLFQIVNTDRKRLKEWLPWLDSIKSLTNEHQYIHYCRDRFEKQGIFTGTILFKNQPCGVISLNYIDWPHKNTAIGYWLGSGFEGKGIMLHACQKIINYSFDFLGLQKVKIFCGVQNIRSQKIPQKLGFTREGRLRDGEWLYDHYVDLYAYSMLKNEWPAAKSKLQIHSS